LKILDICTAAISEEGSTSAMRLAVLGCLLLFFPAFTVVWLKVSWATTTLAAVPDGVIWVLATLFGAKAGQKLIEALEPLLAKK